MSQLAVNSKIAIGLCTYKRPALLAKCLHSIGKMIRPDSVMLCILVVDNDTAGTARSTIAAFKENFDIPIYYEIEKKRGIPCARNTVLKKAKQLGITELAFIDDDEYVDEKWLAKLWAYYVNSDADVVRGHVETVYPPGTPAWIVKGNFHQRPQHVTGRLFNWAATNNVLFNFKKIVVERECYFDDKFLLTGGSDKDFFRRVYAKGSIIRSVEDAVVYEGLSPDRMSVLYLLKRKWRVKNSIYFDSPYNQNQRRVQLLFKHCRLLFRAIFSLLTTCLNGKHAVVKALSEIVAPVAKISALLGIYIKWNEYK